MLSILSLTAFAYMFDCSSAHHLDDDVARYLFGVLHVPFGMNS